MRAGLDGSTTFPALKTPRPAAKPRRTRFRRLRRLRARLRKTSRAGRIALIAGACVAALVVAGLVMSALHFFFKKTGPALAPVAVAWPAGLDADEAAELVAD